jgi:hypothetical protein
MSILLTSDQVADLQSLVTTASAGNQNEQGLWAPVYSALAADLTTVVGEQAVPIDGVPTAVWLWVSAAASANANQGAFANLIRSYTSTQYQLRFGSPMPADELNAASNQIAQNFFATLLNPGNGYLDQNNNLVDLPNLTVIGNIDAAWATGQYFGDYAAWSGNVFFPLLGDNEFFTNWILTLNPNPPGTVEYGTYNLISVAAALQNLSLDWWQVASSLFNGELINAAQLLPLLNANTLPSLISATNNFFATTYGLTQSDGNYDIGDDIFSFLAAAENLTKSATYQVGLLNSPSTITVMNTGQPHVVVLNGTGGTIIDNAGPGIIDGGMNSTATTTVDYSALNIPNSLQLESNVTFGSRIEDDKTSTTTDSDGGSVTTTNVEYLYNVNDIILGSGDDTLTDAALNLPVPPLTIDFGGSKTDPAKGTGPGNEVDASAVTQSLSVQLNSQGPTITGPGNWLQLTLKNVET